MIVPTIGRVVLFFRPGFDQPSPALISYVHDNRRINIGGFDNNGNPLQRTRVALLQDGDQPVEGLEYAAWMPYQKEQAAKSAA